MASAEKKAGWNKGKMAKSDAQAKNQEAADAKSSSDPTLQKDAATCNDQ